MSEKKTNRTTGKPFEALCKVHAKVWFPDKFFIVDDQHPGAGRDKMDLYIQPRTPGNKGLVIECKDYPSRNSNPGKAIKQVKRYQKASRASLKMIWIGDDSNPPPNFYENAEEDDIGVLVIDAASLRKGKKKLLDRFLDWFREENSGPPLNMDGYLETIWPFLDQMYDNVAEHRKKDHSGDKNAALKEIVEEVNRKLEEAGEELSLDIEVRDLDRPSGRYTTQKIDLIKPTTLDVEEQTLTPTYGRFSGEPFERGFGTTIGNALRRVLLSSLTGAAITKVRINGVLHEFSTVSGMTEDVTDLLLNLKEVRFRLEDTDQETIRLDVQGQREVTAADLTVGAQVEILNPDKRLASLGKDTSLEFEAVVQTGRGYVTAERHKSEEDPIGTIPLDAAFSPVRKVNIAITNARVGQRTDYERLALEVWTDGSLKPEEAVASAARIIQDQLNVFAGPGGEQEWRPETGEEPAVVVNENLLQPIEELNLSVRSANCLQSADLRYVGELVQRSEADLLKTKNFGRKSLNEIKETLQSMGLELGLQLDDFPPREELDRLRAEHEPELSS